MAELRDFDTLASFWPTTTTPVTPLAPAAPPPDIIDRDPAIVDMSIPISEEDDTSHIRLADGIMTFLNLYDPSFMVQFFDLGNRSEFFHREKKDLYESTELIIKRNTNVVTVGWYTVMMIGPEVINGVRHKGRLFKDYETVVQFCIENAGSWKPMSAQDVLTGYEWNHDPEMVDLVGLKVAKMLLMRKEWERGAGIKMKTSIDERLEETSNRFQPTSQPFQRTSALFREVEQKGDTLQPSDACFETAAEIQIKADIAAEQAIKHTVVKSRFRILRDFFTGKRRFKDHIVQAEATAPKVYPLEVSAPVVSAPEVSAPEVTAPEATAPEETGPEVTAPEETAPEETAPEETAPEETAPEVTAHPMDSMVFITSALDVQPADDHAIGDSFVQAHGAEALDAKIPDIEGRVVKKRTMEDLFAEAWGIKTKKNKKTKAKAKGNKATNASVDD